ncbi:hypothetical protein WJX73_010106 [Symbiochloris irregularis]|uniref:FAD-binding domain-containing protein n=1 Tax=Symbiochloris irregularis TaxID=706552 RepID=A0AAW1Q2Z7_9CHLO
MNGNSVRQVDVAIVGGGPVGLFTAVALRKAFPGKTIQVYERSSSYRVCGAGINLDLGGMKAFRAVDPDLFDFFQEAVAQIIPPRSRNATDEVQASAVLSNHENYGFHTGLIGWYEIVEALYKALPEGVVQTSHQLEGVESCSDGASKLLFKDQPSVRAQLLIGADGYFSPTRQAVMQDEPPDFANVIVFRARVPWSKELGIGQGLSHVRVERGEKIVMMMYNLKDNVTVWTFTIDADKAREAGVAYDPESYTSSRVQQTASVQNQHSQDSEAYKRCLQLAKATLPQTEHIVADTDPSAVVEHGLFTRPGEKVAALAETGWGKGMVTFIGDAAHSMRPTGQGLNTGLEDVTVLTGHLMSQGLCESALRTFEKERIPRVSTIAQMEYAMAASNYGHQVERPLNDKDYAEFKA